MNDDYLRGFREGQASVYALVDKAQIQRDTFGPSAGVSLMDRKILNMIRDLETTMRLHHEWAAKNISNLRETLEVRTAGLDYPALKRRLDDMERVGRDDIGRINEINRAVDRRFASLEARLEKLEAAGRFWEVERLSDMNFVLGRLEKLEARLP